MATPLTVEYRKTSSLVPYARNARTHSDEQISEIMASIREFGFTNPILVDSDRNIIAGHGRLVAAERLKMDEVPTIELPHLTEAQRRLYVIADNKLALNAGWNEDLLALELGSLAGIDIDIALTGFDADELKALSALPDNEPESSTQEVDPDDYDLGNKCPRCGFEFDNGKT